MVGFKMPFEVRQHWVVRCEEGKNFILHFLILLDFRSVNLISEVIFHEIVGVASFPKARFEVADIMIG